MDSQRVKYLYSLDGFIEEFYKQAQVSQSYEEAYESLEIEFEFVFGSRRYSSYDSFRTIRDRWLNNVKKCDS